MKPAAGYIIVSVDLQQKDRAMIGGNSICTAYRYSHNYRDKAPVVAQIVEGTEALPAGKWLVCNYCYFDWGSQYHLYENLFSIPIDQELFAFVEDDGELTPICGNLLVERVTKETIIEIPDDLKKQYWDRGIVSHGNIEYQSGMFILWLFAADYGIRYTWNGIERERIKIHESEIIGFYN